MSLGLALCAACGSSDDDGDQEGAAAPGSKAEPPALSGITAAHNAIRASVEPPAATPIAPLTWSADVAAVAQTHANTCRFTHDLNSGYGENLHANSGKDDTPQNVVNGWASEVDDYSYTSNGCSQGEQCGHYTQVVWAATQRLGCGVTQCTTNSPFNNDKPWQLWVCNYDPPGNFNNARPY